MGALGTGGGDVVPTALVLEEADVEAMQEDLLERPRRPWSTTP